MKGLEVLAVWKINSGLTKWQSVRVCTDQFPMDFYVLIINSLKQVSVEFCSMISGRAMTANDVPTQQHTLKWMVWIPIVPKLNEMMRLFPVANLKWIGWPIQKFVMAVKILYVAGSHSPRIIS